MKHCYGTIVLLKLVEEFIKLSTVSFHIINVD